MSCQKSYVDMRHFTVTKTFNLYISFITIIFYFLFFFTVHQSQTTAEHQSCKIGTHFIPLYLQGKKYIQSPWKGNVEPLS